MHYRLLGKTGIYVSELCLGTMTFGGKGFWESIGTLNVSEAEKFIGTAFDTGVNFIDTADVYSEGDAEKLTGDALAALARPRDEYVVATKVRGRTGQKPNQVGLSRAHILASLEASLRRLRLDYVDLYQIHGADFETPIEETMSCLDDVVRSGKARYVGFCNLPAWLAMKAISYSDSHNSARFVSAQVYYSLASRDIERELVPLTQDQGLAILPWSPLAGGLLSGKFNLDLSGPKDSRRSSFDFPPVNRPRASAVLNAAKPIAQSHGVSIARVALSWLLTRPFVSSVIVGAKKIDQLQDNLAATDLKLSREQIQELDKASALPLEYPGWMLEWQKRDRNPDFESMKDIKPPSGTL